MAATPAPSGAAVALNRFGLGARPDEAIPPDPRRWLLDQFDRYEPNPAALATLPGTTAQMAEYTDYLAEQRRPKGVQAAAAPVPTRPMDAERMMNRRDFIAASRDDYQAAVNARAAMALTTSTPFVERLVWFWSNHFAVSIEKQPVTALAGPFEAEAIRPYVLGRFEDMLVAVERHPAMQLFLDQVRSVGPGSPQALRVAQRNPGRTPGLNENLAREILELHTLGVRTGYSQADVTDFARALTGWSVGGLNPQADVAPGAFLFRAQVHEPGPRTIMGQRYDQPGEGQARAVLADLATHPATARHIATKLARHFVADDPPPAVVDRLTAAYRKSDGDLPTVYRALVASPEAWAPQPAKFKTPWEWMVSSLRGVGRRDLGQMQPVAMQNQLGQPVWRPGSPAGYDDVAASWAAPDALVRRVELSQRYAALVGDRLDARTLGDKLLPGVLGEATRSEISRAESPAAALALLLVSPEFQRR
jgi:uncharacterized protein (DUF1800 family)